MVSRTWTAILEKNPNSIKITVLFDQIALFVNFLNLFYQHISLGQNAAAALTITSIVFNELSLSF